MPCSCQKTRCTDARCGCVKVNAKCDAKCKCLHCENDRTEDFEVKFQPTLVIATWNICKAAAALRNPDKFRLMLHYIVKTSTAQIIVFQEVNQKGEAREELLQAIQVFFPNTDDYGEHVFAWTNEIRKYNDRERPRNCTKHAATMRFYWEQVPFKLTSVHTSPKTAGKDAKEIFDLLSTSKDGLRNVIAGDFNFNPHDSEKPWVEFQPTGTVSTKTSVGRQGYDFFFVDWKTWEETECVQFGMIPRQFKNSSKSQRGMSDHACQVLRLTPYPVTKPPEDESTSWFCGIM